MTYGPIGSPDMPRALGPYSHAVRAGDLVFISGQPGIDPATGAPPDGGFEAEARQAFTNLRTVVEAAGGTLARVVKTTVYLADVADFAAMNELYGEYFPSDPPARSTPTIVLPRNLRISIDAVVFVG